MLSSLCNAVVHVAAVKTPHNLTVCYYVVLCAHNDAKMQKHSLQPHYDATGGK